MVGISEVLQTMVAMIIFSMMLLNANRMILRNTMMQVDGELEQEVIALAQDIIEEGRTKAYDEITVEATAPPADIPGNFISPSNLGSDDEGVDSENSNTDDDLNGDGEVKRTEFDDFDDYNGWVETLETEHGEFHVETEVFYLDPATLDSSTTGLPTTFKKMRVRITNQFLTKTNSDNATIYELEFIRNYYAD